MGQLVGDGDRPAGHLVLATTQGQAIEKQAPLPAERQGEDDAPADDLGEDFDIDRAIAQASIAEALEAALARMDNAEHVAILRRAMPIWDDQPSKLVAEEFGTTAMNVDQIKSRFRAFVREECERRGWGAS